MHRNEYAPTAGWSCFSFGSYYHGLDVDPQCARVVEEHDARQCDDADSEEDLHIDVDDVEEESLLSNNDQEDHEANEHDASCRLCRCVDFVQILPNNPMHRNVTDPKIRHSLDYPGNFLLMLLLSSIDTRVEPRVKFRRVGHHGHDDDDHHYDDDDWVQGFRETESA